MVSTAASFVAGLTLPGARCDAFGFVPTRGAREVTVPVALAAGGANAGAALAEADAVSSGAGSGVSERWVIGTPPLSAPPAAGTALGEVFVRNNAAITPSAAAGTASHRQRR